MDLLKAFDLRWSVGHRFVLEMRLHAARRDDEGVGPPQLCRTLHQLFPRDHAFLRPQRSPRRSGLSLFSAAFADGIAGASQRLERRKGALSGSPSSTSPVVPCATTSPTAHVPNLRQPFSLRFPSSPPRTPGEP